MLQRTSRGNSDLVAGDEPVRLVPLFAEAATVSGGRGTGVLGFEPRQADPESAVLPLHHTPREPVMIWGPAGVSRLARGWRRLEGVRA